jgi:hypothetical protein
MTVGRARTWRAQREAPAALRAIRCPGCRQKGIDGQYEGNHSAFGKYEMVTDYTALVSCRLVEVHPGKEGKYA